MEPYESAIDTKPFLIIKVKDYLWGYPSILISIEEYQRCKNQKPSRRKRDENSDSDPFGDNADSDPFGDSDYDNPCDMKYVKEDSRAQMGLFLNRNNTALDHRKINTGKTYYIVSNNQFDT